MAQHETLLFLRYSTDGQLSGQEDVDTISIDSAAVEQIGSQLKNLSGDLDLPLEFPLPGSIDGLVLRICADKRNAAYAVYYQQDEPVFASLVLAGRDDRAETDLMHVFKFLLLDDGDEEEPDDSQVESILESDEFDFAAIEERPAVFQIQFFDDDVEQQQLNDEIAVIDQQVALAFLSLPENSK